MYQNCFNSKALKKISIWGVEYKKKVYISDPMNQTWEDTQNKLQSQ